MLGSLRLFLRSYLPRFYVLKLFNIACEFLSSLHPVWLSFLAERNSPPDLSGLKESEQNCFESFKLLWQREPRIDPPPHVDPQLVRSIAVCSAFLRSFYSNGSSYRFSISFRRCSFSFNSLLFYSHFVIKSLSRCNSSSSFWLRNCSFSRMKVSLSLIYDSFLRNLSSKARSFYSLPSSTFYSSPLPPLCY